MVVVLVSILRILVCDLRFAMRRGAVVLRCVEALLCVCAVGRGAGLGRGQKIDVSS